MKSVITKVLKSILVFIISSIIIYIILTIGYFLSWCNDNQLKIFTKDIASEIPYLNEDKIYELGDYVGSYAQLLKESMEEQNQESNEAYMIAEHFDPLGFSIWSYLREIVVKIIDRYNTISILLGICTTIAYNVIISKKIHNLLKVAIGYVVPMLIIPPIYTYLWTGRLWDFADMYVRGIPQIFYIIYTVIFILIYIINYIVVKKMVKTLNQSINKKEDVLVN